MGRPLVLTLAVLLLGTAARDGSDEEEGTTPAVEEAPGSRTDSEATPETSPAERASGPGELFEELLRFQSLGQHGREWDRLHPSLKAVVSRTKYDGCRRENAGPVPPEGFEFEVVEVYEDPIDIPETPEKTSTAVTFRVRVKGTDAAQTSTAHTLQVGGEWVWVLAPEDVDDYKRGDCPV